MNEEGETTAFGAEQAHLVTGISIAVGHTNKFLMSVNPDDTKHAKHELYKANQVFQEAQTAYTMHHEIKAKMEAGEPVTETQKAVQEARMHLAEFVSEEEAGLWLTEALQKAEAPGLTQKDKEAADLEVDDATFAVEKAKEHQYGAELLNMERELEECPEDQKEDLKHKIQIKKNQMDSDKKSAIAAVMAAERTHEVGLFP